MEPDRKYLGCEIKSLSNHLKRSIYQTMVIQSEKNITATHGMIINYLAHAEGDVFQRDIETKFSMRRSTVSGILDVMEKNNLITREHVESDARLRRIVLTRKGIALHNRVSAELLRLENIMRAGISDEELEAFFSTAEKIKHNLEQ